MLVAIISFLNTIILQAFFLLKLDQVWYYFISIKCTMLNSIRDCLYNLVRIYPFNVLRVTEGQNDYNSKTPDRRLLAEKAETLTVENTQLLNTGVHAVVLLTDVSQTPAAGRAWGEEQQNSPTFSFWVIKGLTLISSGWSYPPTAMSVILKIDVVHC